VQPVKACTKLPGLFNMTSVSEEPSSTDLCQELVVLQQACGPWTVPALRKAPTGTAAIADH